MNGSRQSGNRDAGPALAGGARRPRAPAAERNARPAGRRWFGGLVAAAAIGFCLAGFGATDDLMATNASTSAGPAKASSRELYNAGTQKLAEGKLADAETLLRSALARQDGGVQPRALYNLGCVRFAEGTNELKRSPPMESTVTGETKTAEAADQAIQQAQTALNGNDLQQLVTAYLQGQGMHRELLAATEAVKRAMEMRGGVLLKWRRALGDFRSAAELNPADTNATRNAELVERHIARLVDSLRQMQQAAMMARSKSTKLNQLMQQLRGRIPKPMLPPGAPGDDQDVDQLLEGMRGEKEAPSRGGREFRMTLAPDEAEKLLDGIRFGGSQELPMMGDLNGRPAKPSNRTW